MYYICMENIATSLNLIVTLMKQNSAFVLLIIGALWAIHIVNYLLRYHLNYFGILPRHPLGLPGIVLSPVLHGNFTHLLFNSIPLYMLANFALLEGKKNFYCITAVIILVSGSGVWLFGRRALHIGASGVIMGYWSYLLANAYYNPTAISIILGIVTIYYFGGMVLNLFPTDIASSWEGHVFGFIGGIVANYACPSLLTVF